MTIWRVPINITWPGAGSPGVNVWHVRCNSGLGADATELQAAVDSIHTFYSSLYTAHTGAVSIFAPGVNHAIGQVVEVSSESLGTPTFTKLGGATTGNAAAPALQICVTWKTALAARRGRGRTFLGPLMQYTEQADGTPVDADLAAIGTACQGIVTRNQANNGWAVSVYGQQSVMKGKEVTAAMRAAAPHVARDITGYGISDKFAVLRGRRD